MHCALHPLSVAELHLLGHRPKEMAILHLPATSFCCATKDLMDQAPLLCLSPPDRGRTAVPAAVEAVYPGTAVCRRPTQTPHKLFFNKLFPTNLTVSQNSPHLPHKTPKNSPTSSSSPNLLRCAVLFVFIIVVTRYTCQSERSLSSHARVGSAQARGGGAGVPGAQPGGRSRVRRAARWEQLVVVAVPLVLLVVVAAVGRCYCGC